MASLLAAQLVPRLGTAEDVAAAVVYLASAASSFMTAQTLVLDGGLTAYVPVMSPRARGHAAGQRDAGRCPAVGG